MSWFPPLFGLITALVLSSVTLSANTAGQSAVTGIIRDRSGAAVPGATVLVRTPSGAEETTVSGADGRFVLSRRATEALTLIVSADGFAPHREPIASNSARQDLTIVLSPATVSETVTVTAARAEQRAADVAASVTVLGSAAVDRSPALVADDLLRQVPTFSLFRRASSLASHPTAQGVSLRGIGPSGVSRTLVLFDGMPFNDPFGGWVYWTRVPLASVDRIEVLDGASSSIYGNYAMGGVVNIVTASPRRRLLEIKTQYGNRNTAKLDLSASRGWGPIAASVDGSLFTTAGYPVVRDDERGAVDTDAAVEFANATLKLQYDFTDRVHGFVRGSHFREDRANGKISTVNGAPEENDTTWTSVGGGLRAHLPEAGEFQLSAFISHTRFRSNFLAVSSAAAPRDFGRMTLTQTVPSDSAGGMAQWSRILGAFQFLTAGVDWQRVEGESQELVLDATGTRPILDRRSGGTQRSAGAYVQNLMTPMSRLAVTLAARVDYWRNEDGHNLEMRIPVSSEPNPNHQPSLAARTDTVVSPRVSAIYHVTDWISVWGAIGTGFRAPTLNELYRQFRVGSVTTRANHQLGPERLLGKDAGIRIVPTRALTLRTTWFDNRVEDPVSNVTLSVNGENVISQRQNLGRTRIRGIQTDAEYRAHDAFTISGGYVYTAATIREFDGRPELEGKVLPQVPRHRGTVQATYTNPRVVNASVAMHAVGRQFDDDLNQRRVPGYSYAGLPGYVVIDVNVSRSLSRRVEIFGGAQNALGAEYFVGTLPTTVGTPRLVHGGLRVRVGRR